MRDRADWINCGAFVNWYVFRPKNIQRGLSSKCACILAPFLICPSFTSLMHTRPLPNKYLLQYLNRWFSFFFRFLPIHSPFYYVRYWCYGYYFTFLSFARPLLRCNNYRARKNSKLNIHRERKKYWVKVQNNTNNRFVK